jgi:hypothetical protein
MDGWDGAYGAIRALKVFLLWVEAFHGVSISVEEWLNQVHRARLVPLEKLMHCSTEGPSFEGVE